MTAAAPQNLWNRNFVLWWLGNAQSSFGAALSSIATSFLVLHQTGSAGAMGINLALGLLPGLLTPFLGAVVDRLPLRIPIVLGNLLRAVVELTIGVLALRGTVPTELIYAGSFVVGLISAFYQPATMGMIARLVPAADLERATGLMQGTSQSMQMVGLLGGGFLAALIGRGESLLLAGGLFGLFAGLSLLIRFPAPRQAEEGETFWDSFKAGLRYVRGSALLVGLPLLALVMNAAFAPLEMLIPKQMVAYGAGERGYGVFFGLLLGGMVLGSLLIAMLGPKLNAAKASVWGMAITSVAMLGLALTHTPLQMYLLALPTGIFNAFVNVGISILFQKKVDPDYFGRVGSLLNMMGMVGMPITLLLLAPVADRLSIGAMFAVTGGVGLVCAVLWQILLWRDAAQDRKTLKAQTPPEPAAD